MTLFCSAREFECLCRDIADKAQTMRLQAKGGSMHPFIRSGDWVNVALSRGSIDGCGKGDMILFSKDGSLYLHRVLRRNEEGFLVKGDMSFGSDGIVAPDAVLAKAVSIQRGLRRIDLNTKAQRFLAVAAADCSFALQYPHLFARNICAFAMAGLVRLQALRLYRRMAKTIRAAPATIRNAGPQDEEQLRDLYLMAGKDIREGLARIKTEGFWLVAERGRKVVAGLTMIRYEKDPGLWLIFGLEVKPLFRGQGIGRMIVGEAVSNAKKTGVKRIGLFVNKRSLPAIALYRGLGFEATDSFPAEFNRSAGELYLLHTIDG